MTFTSRSSCLVPLISVCALGLAQAQTLALPDVPPPTDEVVVSDGPSPLEVGKQVGRTMAQLVSEDPSLELGAWTGLGSGGWIRFRAPRLELDLARGSNARQNHHRVRYADLLGESLLVDLRLVGEGQRGYRLSRNEVGVGKLLGQGGWGAQLNMKLLREQSTGIQLNRYQAVLREVGAPDEEVLMTVGLERLEARGPGGATRARVGVERETPTVVFRDGTRFKLNVDWSLGIGVYDADRALSVGSHTGLTATLTDPSARRWSVETSLEQDVERAGKGLVARVTSLTTEGSFALDPAGRFHALGGFDLTRAKNGVVEGQPSLSRISVFTGLKAGAFFTRAALEAERIPGLSTQVRPRVEVGVNLPLGRT
ncbi:MAG: hypothetical protein R3F62_27125 [Planctomycetota bacterium]